MTTEEALFCLLRNEICGVPLPVDFNLTDQIEDIYRLSKRHDIAHLIGDAICRNNLLPESKILYAFKQQMMMAVYRYEQQNAEFKRICEAFDEAKIPYIPLKGSVIRKYYSEPWMRTSCDIDILIHEQDINRATQSLIGSGYNTDEKVNFHDIHFYNKHNHLELHFNICENNKQLDGLLSKVWEYVNPISEYEYREYPEFFMFHHIAHMAYHFLSGGCGIRPFIDLWILQKRDFYSEEKLIPLLKKCNLIKFYEAVKQLTLIWMADEKHDDLTMKMEKYVLNGGVYGTSANADSIGLAASKGKKKYLLKMAFPPYSTMCIIYPSLKRHKILLPFYYIHRVFIKLFGKDKQRVKAKIDSTMSQSQEQIAEANNLLCSLCLRK